MASYPDIHELLVKSKYRNVDATKKDVMQVLRMYHGLSYVSEDYESTYHIPICIILMDTHPHNAPMCFVKPTPEMHIKVSRFVDHNGKVYLPYLHDWQP
uniref:Uncharacterized protein n=1 Tax=Phlebotomus papatasi TaxID=29031 RepID=A0A1B0DB49_PHLPP